MIPKPLQAVIFDMDGLLLDTEVLYRAAIFAACAAQGHEMVDHVHHSLIGTPKDLGDAKLAAYFGDTFDLERYHVVCAEHFDSLCETEVPLRPGVRSLLDVLEGAAIPTAVATSTARRQAEAQLKKAGIFDSFDVLVTRSEVKRGKPHPETFLKAAELLNVDPANCLVLEDSHNGIRAATAAGMSTIMIPDLLQPNAEIEKLCVGVLSSLDDVRFRFLASREASEPGPR
jgi:HAD superfamily hydrolase (TIGR01509 family)